MRLILTLFVLLFTQLFLNLAHASPQAQVSAEQKKGQISQASPDDRKKRKADKSTKKAKIASDKTSTSKTTTNKTTANNDKKKLAANTTKTIKKKAQQVSKPATKKPAVPKRRILKLRLTKQQRQSKRVKKRLMVGIEIKRKVKRAQNSSQIIKLSSALPIKNAINTPNKPQ